MHLSNDQYQSDTHEFATDNFISIDACTCPKCDYEHAEMVTSEEISGAINIVTITRCSSCGYHSDSEAECEPDTNEDDDYYSEMDVLNKLLAMSQAIDDSLYERGFVKGELITEYKLYALTHTPNLYDSKDCDLLRISLPAIAKMTPKRPMRERVLNAT